MHEKKQAQLLFDEHLIGEQSLHQINSFEDQKNFSIKSYLDFSMYAGVTLLASGLGILIYKNIESIGHVVLVVLIGLLCLGCFAYCHLKKNPFSLSKVNAPNVAFDYIVLLGALLLLTFIGYLQFQFQIFGERYGLATFIPCLLLFFAAYYFDHLGVLSMAIVLLGSWLGITITPVALLKGSDFEGDSLIYTGIVLALFLAAAAFFTFKKDVKKHFHFTYFNFALHIGFIAALCGLFTLQAALLWAIVIALFFAASFKYALAEKSFYVLLVIFFYGYIAATYFIFRIFEYVDGAVMLYIILFYFIFSAMMLIKYLRQFKKQFQSA